MKVLVPEVPTLSISIVLELVMPNDKPEPGVTPVTVRGKLPSGSVSLAVTLRYVLPQRGIVVASGLATGGWLYGAAVQVARAPDESDLKAVRLPAGSKQVD